MISQPTVRCVQSPYIIPPATVCQCKQEAKLSQRGRTTLHVIGNFAIKSHKVSRHYTAEYGLWKFLLLTVMMSLSCTVSDIFNFEEWRAVPLKQTELVVVFQVH